MGRRTAFQKIMRDHQIEQHALGSHRPNQNPAEGSVGESKRRWCRLQFKLSVPDRLADFGVQRAAEAGNLAANGSRCVKGRMPLEHITGDTPDTSEFTDFGFCDCVQFRENAGLGLPQVGGWLGVSH